MKIVSNHEADALPIRSDAEVLSCFLQGGQGVEREIGKGYGAYIHVLEGGPVKLDGHSMDALAAAMVSGEERVRLHAHADAEILFVHVSLAR